jgi:flagellar hook protein FlgE
MLRSLSSAVSGLRNQQTKMDVIGNNVSNVNTVAFKAGRVTFKEGFAQLVESASRPVNGAGGTNPMMVGLGSQIGTMDTMFTQGNLETTGRHTDLAIQGNSFFVVKKGAETFYTRSGNFQIDANGTMVSGNNGFAVQGRMATNGKLGDTVTDVTIPVLQTAPANPTSKVSVSGNLDAAAKVFDQGSAQALDPLDPAQRALPDNKNSYKDMSITVYDSLGTKHELKLVMWKTGANTWDWKFDDAAMDIDQAGLTETAGTHPITFKTDGSVDTDNNFAVPAITFQPNSGAAAVNITLDLGSGMNGLSQFGGSSTAVMRDQDGYTNGTLQNFTIDASGTIVGGFTNGITQILGQIQLADFNNPEGLARVGDNAYTTTANSGGAVYGYAGEGSTSSIASGALEMSNVDLAQEFTNMIIAQRGFQANGRVISTTDQLMEELVQLKR